MCDTESGRLLNHWLRIRRGLYEAMNPSIGRRTRGGK